jgi:preprotein translocase subunit YajC
MDFLVQTAQAANGGDGGGNPLMGLLLPILILVLFYFLFIRPQQKRAKEHSQMISELTEGDEVVSSGGLAGKITAVDDNFVSLEIADNVEVRLQKKAVSNVLPKGTL